jgi:hypothetical protein
MSKCFISIIFIFMSGLIPLFAEVNSKQNILDQLFKELEIEKNLTESAEQSLPKTPQTLNSLFGEEQEKFNEILVDERKMFLNKWVQKSIEGYKSVWNVVMGQQFSEEALKEMLEIYTKDNFKKFTHHLGKIEQSLADLTQNQQGQIALSYGDMLLSALSKAKEAGFDTEIIASEADRIQSIQEMLKQGIMSKKQNFFR